MSAPGAETARIRLWRDIALVALVPLTVLFLAFPEADIAFSRLFADASGRFPYTGGIWQVMRMIVWDLIVLGALASLALLVIALVRRRRGEIRLWLFASLSFALGPGLLVNGILKNYWGRARPQSVQEFGGTAAFTPPVLPADQCAHNCSFVSGEAAGAVTLALVAWLILAPRLAPRWRRPFALGLAAFALWGALMRVMAGRHFLSDVLFAADLMIVLVLSLYLWLDVARHRKGRGESGESG